MRALLARAADRIVPAENPSGVVYGIIVIGALLAAESGRHETYLDTLASAAIAAMLYWFAHAYAEVLGRRLTRHEHLSARTLARTLARDWAIVEGAALPLAIASLVAFELIAGIRSRASPRELALEGGAGAAMGIAILALKIVLH
jgi:hypothetical protein